MIRLETDRVHYGRGGFLGFGKGGHLRLTEEAVEFRPKGMDPLAVKAPVRISLDEISWVGRKGYSPADSWPFWAKLLFYYGTAWILVRITALFIRRWLVIHTTAARWQFWVGGGKEADRWIEAINEERRRLLEAK